MSDYEISAKLNVFLKRHVPLDEECHVVYVMVELRKLIEHWGFDAPLLKFYADWTLHTEKTGNLQHIGPIAHSMYVGVESHITVPNDGMIKAMERFLGMEELRKQMKKLFDAGGINAALLDHDALWKRFVDLFSAVLADQPIRQPCGAAANVSEIRFIPAGGCEIRFVNPIAHHQSFHYRTT